MAVMGLRSLYFLIIAMLTRLRFLHYGLAAVLAFAAIKMLASHWIEIGPVLSLAVILALLAITISASLWAPRNRNELTRALVETLCHPWWENFFPETA
jgi:tellurite resistance protein TerC